MLDGRQIAVISYASGRDLKEANSLTHTTTAGEPWENAPTWAETVGPWGRMSCMGFQLVIDCADPERLVRFWAAALGYRVQDPPEGHATWRDYYLSVGVPEEELGDGDCADRLVDPAGSGPAIWFQVVPEKKTLKNRLHLDVLVGGGRSVPVAVRRQRVDADVEQLVRLGATVPYKHDDGTVDHYAVTMADPEGNGFCVALPAGHQPRTEAAIHAASKA